MEGGESVGLKEILEIYNMSISDLAQKLGIARGNIYNWFNGKRKIPRDMLKKLSQLFNLPEEFFSRELSETDILNVKRTMVENLIDEVSFEYTEAVEDDDGSETIITQTYINNSLLQWRDELCNDINNQRIKDSIVDRVNRTLKSGSIANKAKNLSDSIDIIESNIVPSSVFNNILQAVLYSYGLREYKSDNKTSHKKFTEDLMRIIKNHEDERQKEKKKLDDLINSSIVSDLF
ncbi:hypothetical protein SDC9_108696 [bioreactor metagenome]|uniref:HTH cro/C1-type domain-containing protein n=1 Tax=bioreactor metagenome TaxID=1076179 RepID=A0A645BF82_9ZZZZ